eukprot:GHVT01093825.1.p1 GENE.GHVT01093825.1~~GHVT01093825.1.p1  ORF type:complete len:308 (-),score=10.82 GHVT01093825.1:398-1321(-)
MKSNQKSTSREVKRLQEIVVNLTTEFTSAINLTTDSTSTTMQESIADPTSTAVQQIEADRTSTTIQESNADPTEAINLITSSQDKGTSIHHARKDDRREDRQRSPQQMDVHGYHEQEENGQETVQLNLAINSQCADVPGCSNQKDRTQEHRDHRITQVKTMKSNQKSTSREVKRLQEIVVNLTTEFTSAINLTTDSTSTTMQESIADPTSTAVQQIEADRTSTTIQESNADPTEAINLITSSQDKGTSIHHARKDDRRENRQRSLQQMDTHGYHEQEGNGQETNQLNLASSSQCADAPGCINQKDII